MDEPGEKTTAPVMQEVKPMLKSEALAPVTAGVFVIVTALPVPFVRVAVMDAANPPRAVEGNVTGLGENTTAVLPMPVRLAVIGLEKPVGPV